MTVLFKKYIALFSVFVCFFLITQLNAQEAKQDTLSLVKDYQLNAKKAISSQDFENAIINLNNATLLVVNSKDNILKASIHLSFAELQYNLHNFKKAESEILNTITHLKNTEDKLRLGKAYNLYGLILIKVHKHNEAEIYLKKADAIFTTLNDEKNQAITLQYFGILELERNNPSIAINYFEATLPLLVSSDLSFNEAQTYLYEAEAFLKISDTENKNLHLAKVSFEKSIQIIQQYSYIKLKIESFKIASQIAIRENKPKESASLLNSYSTKKILCLKFIFKLFQKALNTILT